MVGREAPFRPFSGREAPISLNFSNWHPFFEFCFFLIPFLQKTLPRGWCGGAGGGEESPGAAASASSSEHEDLCRRRRPGTLAPHSPIHAPPSLIRLPQSRRGFSGVPARRSRNTAGARSPEQRRRAQQP
jgi:hypothetical protein